jgi:hypothetical protein
MNPLFVNTPAQRSAVREQYLSSLQLQIENDMLNLNANKILKFTGETPTQITDTRTTEEKFADMIGTRRDVKSFLVASGYLTPFNANVYVDKAGDGIIQFIYRNKQFILRDYLSKGVSPRMFEDFIESYVAKYQRNAGIEMGVQQASSGEAPIISNNQLLNRIINQKTLTDVAGFLVLIEKDGGYGLQGEQMIEETRNLVDVLRDRIPTPEQMRRVDNLSNASQAVVRVFLNDTYKEYPAREQVERKLGELQRARERRDTQRVFGVLRQINGLLGVGSTNQPNLEQLLRSVEGASSTGDEDGREKDTRDDATAEEEEEEIEEATPDQKQTRRISYFEAQELEQLLSSQKKINDFLSDTGLMKNATLDGEPIPATRMRTMKPSSVHRRDTNWRELVNIYLTDKNILEEEIINRQFRTDTQRFLTKEEVEGLDVVAVDEISSPAGDEAAIAELVGRGAVKSRKDKFKRKVEFVGEKPKPYISFGKFYLNRHKLNDDILQIKGEGGQNTNYKTRRISPTLKSVFKSLLENKTPDFSLISKLSDADKNNLHEAIQITKYDKITIDAPSKSADEKIANEFDVLRGSILGGNDSPQAIKRFKLLLVKLMNSKRIPRGEANEILFGLAELGY